MKSVTMSHSRVVKTFPIVVNAHRTICDFIATVAIYIRHTQVVVALPSISTPLR